MEDLDKVEPAVLEAQQGNSSSLLLTILPSVVSSGEIDQETKFSGNKKSQQSPTRS